MIVLGVPVALTVAACVACNVDWYDVRDRRNARRLGRPNSRLSKKASSLRERLRDLSVRRSELATLYDALFSHDEKRARIYDYIGALDVRIEGVIDELRHIGVGFDSLRPEYNATWRDDAVEAERFVRHYGLRERSRGDFYVDPCGPLGLDWDAVLENGYAC